MKPVVITNHRPTGRQYTRSTRVLSACRVVGVYVRWCRVRCLAVFEAMDDRCFMVSSDEVLLGLGKVGQGV